MMFRPAYGAASLAAHREGARKLGYELTEVRRPGLAFDVDTEADLIALGALASALGQRGLDIRVDEVFAFE
jgi:2-phospho-L-lactate guanylyltransferase (CobY/MobA/RfbA family)